MKTLSDLFYTKYEAAVILRCSPRTIDRRIKSGYLQSIKDVGRELIPKSSVEDYIKRLKGDAQIY